MFCIIRLDDPDFVSGGRPVREPFDEENIAGRGPSLVDCVVPDVDSPISVPNGRSWGPPPNAISDSSR